MSALRKLAGTIMVLVFGIISFPAMVVALALSAIATIAGSIGKGLMSLMIAAIRLAQRVGGFKTEDDSASSGS